MNKLFTTLSAVTLAATFSLAAVAPASAGQAAVTRNTILGAAALIAGIAIENDAQNHAYADNQNYYRDNRNQRDQVDQRYQVDRRGRHDNTNNDRNNDGRWNGR